MEKLLTIKDVADALQVSPWTIRAWCSQGYIPYFKLKGLVRFREKDIEVWLRKNLSPGRSLHRFKIERK